MTKVADCIIKSRYLHVGDGELGWELGQCLNCPLAFFLLSSLLYAFH